MQTQSTAAMTPSINPTSLSWTLRLKYDRTTILLHVDPLQPLAAIRGELLKAIRQTNPCGQFYGVAIPESEADILLARQVDEGDLDFGWELLEQDDENMLALVDDEEGAKGKRKAGGLKAAKNKLTDCPQGAGLRDGGVVAFKFRGQSQVHSQTEKVMEDSDEEADGAFDEKTLVGDSVAEKWNVVVPTMEETYRDEDEEGAVPVLMPRNAT